MKKLFVSILLMAGAATASAQIKVLDQGPMRAYNLRGDSSFVDVGLIAQMKKQVYVSRKCPYCVNENKKSKLYFGILIMPYDTVRRNTYYNEAGTLVIDDREESALYLNCSRGHKFSITKKGDTSKTEPY